MKIGDLVSTPDGTGRIVDILAASKEWHGSGRKPIQRGPYAILLIRGRRKVWAFDKLKPYTVSEKRERENDPD